MDLLIGDVFRSAARTAPDRPAAALGDRSLTFGEVDSTANRIGRVLRSQGIGHGDRVAVWAATTLETVPLFAALAKMGAVFAPMNPALSAEEATETASAARPALLVVDDARSDADVGGAVAAKIGARVVTLAALSTAAADEDEADTAVDGLTETDPHVIFFTSGST